MFVGGLAIGGERFEVGTKRVPDAASHSACRDFGWGGFALAQRFLQGGDCDVDPNGAAVAEDIGDGLRHAEDRDRDPLDVVRLNAVAKKLVGKADNAQRRIVDLGLPVFRTDRDPHPTRHLIGDTVEGEGRDEADYALGHALGGLGKGMIAIGGGVRELIESAAELGDEALPFQSGDGGGGDAGPADFGEAGNTALAQNAASCSRWVRARPIQFLGSLELSSEEINHLAVLLPNRLLTVDLGVARGVQPACVGLLPDLRSIYWHGR